jgi:hypothetical protein
MRKDWETYSPVWTLPHLFELELFHTSLVRCDCRAFDTDFVLLDGFGSIDGDLVIGLVRKQASGAELGIPTRAREAKCRDEDEPCLGIRARDRST